MEVYILYSKNADRYYIGQSENSQERLRQHISGFLPNSYSRIADDWVIYLTISCRNREQALKIERHIKRMKSRKYIENLKRYPAMIEKLQTMYE